VKSPAEFRRQLDHGARRSTTDAVPDVTDASDALPTLELTVGVRDGGSPPRSTLSRLTVVVDELAAVPDGRPVLVPSSSSTFNRLSWTQGLFIVVGSSLGAALLATVVFIVVVSSSC